MKCFGVRLDDEKIENIIKRDCAYWDQYGFGPYVWFEKSSKRFIGEGGLNHAIPDGKPEIELTYSLLPQYWGQGYATEIGKLAIHQAFELLDLSDLVCFTSEDNFRSQHVMKKLGFQYEKDFVYAGIKHQLSRLRSPVCGTKN